MKRARLAVAVAIVLAASTPSCRLFRKHPRQAPFVLPPPPPAVRVEPPAPLPVPPEMPVQALDWSQTVPPLAPGELPPPPRRRARPRAHEPGEAAPAAPAAEAPAPEIPQLEQILTAQQRQAYNEAIERNIGIAKRTVDALQRRRLSRQQAAYLARIRAFIEQANQARATDLVRARNLAERASVLAEDLRKSLQ
jgi:hypothetical protein